MLANGLRTQQKHTEENVAYTEEYWPVALLGTSSINNYDPKP
jgi:hypothetical protein